MTEERLGSPSEFAAKLGPHLARFREGGMPLPSAAQLALLVETMFFASLHAEEARHSDFGVAWQPDLHDCVASIILAHPVALTPKNLAKLAPATAGESTAIALRHEGSAIVAWALIERSVATHQPLTIRSLEAGVLRIDYGGVARAMYARGEMVLLGDPRDVKAPSWWLSETFDAWHTAVEDGGVDLRATVVSRLATQILTHRHGGMILIMPADAREPVGVRVHYDVAEGTDILARRYERVIRGVAPAERLMRLKGTRARGYDGRISVRDEDQLAFAETIELIARLTAVDNALLLDTDLRVRGFGVQVIEGEATQATRTFEHTNPYSGETHTDDVSTFKGTRHPAGVIYCLRQPHEAAAIVASQDGHLTLVVKNRAGAVRVVGSYENAFGWR